jgi:hypothetical protein
MAGNRSGIRGLMPRPTERAADDAHAFSPLHWMVAGIFIAAGAEAAFGRRRGEAPDAVRWAPLVVGPLAGAAHVARAVLPGALTRIAAQVLNGVALGVGVIGAASSTWAVVEEGSREWRWTGPRRKPLAKRVPSLAPLTFGAAGALGMLLDRQERLDSVEHARLERRARIVERLVPKPRRRVERIVVHV